MTFSLPSSVAPKSGAISGRHALFAGVGALLALAAYNSFYTVNPTERAGVRIFGTVVTDRPMGPGLHIKAPFVSRVDYAQVSLTNLHIPNFAVNTIDNQKIDLDINVTYLVPDSAVFHLLYEVGRSGSADINDNIIPVVQDRVGRVFAARNTNALSENRESIQAEATRAALARAIDRLHMLQIVEHALAVGDMLPEFMLPDVAGGMVGSEQLLAQGPLVVAFVRGPWCPYCSLALRALDEALPAIEACGATLAVISPMRSDDLARAAAERGLKLRLLSDTEGAYARLCGLHYEMSDAHQELYQRLGLDLTQMHAGSGWALPIPAAYVVGRDGIITFAEAHADWAQRAEPAEIIAALARSPGACGC